MSESITPESLPPAGQPAFDHPYALFRNKDYVRYLFGRLVSTFGQQMLAIFLGKEIWDRTHSAMTLAMIGLTQFTPMLLFTLPAGHVADQYNRKQVILFMTIIVAATNLGLAFISAFQAPVYLAYFCLFTLGAAGTFLRAASASFLPQLVSRKEFPKAVNFSVSAFQTATILGPLTGGFLVAESGHYWIVYAVSTGTALMFCYLLSRIHIHHVAPVREKTSFKTLLNGFSFVFSTRLVLGIITLDMFAVLFGGVTGLLPIYATEILHIGNRGLGLLGGAMPIGAILCSFIMAHRPPMKKAGRSLLLAVSAFGVFTIVFGFSHWFWLSFVMLFLCGAVDNISVIIRQTLVQLTTPDEKRGRVSAVNNLFIGTSNELGEFESNIAAQWLGVAFHTTIATGATISAVGGGVATILVVVAVALIWPEIRKYGRLDA